MRLVIPFFDDFILDVTEFGEKRKVYYGTRKDWPGLAEAEKQATSDGKAERVNSATKEKVSRGVFTSQGSDFQSRRDF